MTAALVIAAVLLVALVVGLLVGSGLRLRSRGPVVLVCSCKHGYSAHHRGGQCTGTTQRPTRYDGGYPVEVGYVPCPCRAYDGPAPIQRDAA